MRIVIIVLLIVLIVKVSRLNKVKKWDNQEEDFRTVQVMLLEDYDTDLINYLNQVENKSEFFKFAARKLINDEEWYY